MEKEVFLCRFQPLTKLKALIKQHINNQMMMMIDDDRYRHTYPYMSTFKVFSLREKS